jgi:hypothetical protein
LRRSLAAPMRVDFGPFQCGFLSSPSGMTSIVPPRPRVGVSLPMGVKVPPATKELSVPWTKNEEELLRACILAKGTNWMLAARTLTGLQDIETVSIQVPRVKSVARAGRSCREHWHVMARNDPMIARELRQAERFQREKANHRFGQLESTDSVARLQAEGPGSMGLMANGPSSQDKVVKREFLLPSQLPRARPLDVVASQTGVSPKAGVAGEATSGEKEDAEMGNAPDSTVTAHKRRSFSAIVAARGKTVRIPRTIPGVQSGSAPTIAPSHPSHMQAVQKSVTAKWSGGRTDMWPLQFLDAADRHRVPLPGPPQRVMQSSSSSRNHGSAAPPGGRPNFSSGSHRMPTSVPQQQQQQQQRVQHPLANSASVGSTRVLSSSAATMQSFAPPSSRPTGRPHSDDNNTKGTPKK